MAHTVHLVEQAIRECRRQGFRVRQTRKGYVVYSKDGVHTAGFHKTPSDKHGFKNSLKDLRRIGVDI